MARQRWVLTASCVLMLSASVFAQAEKAGPVLSQIPAGSMGYIIVPSVEGMTGKIDKFIDDLGFGQMLSQPDPADPEKVIKLSVLDLLTASGQLGEGFNPKGSLAVVMLNPKDYGINLLELMPGAAPPADDAAAKPEPKLPVVIYIPGKDIKTVLGAYNPKQTGKYMTVTLPVGPMFAGQAGGYVLLSPNDKALDAVAAAVKKADSELPAEQLKAITGSEISIVLNGKTSGPVLMELMQVAEAQAMTGAEEMAPLLGTYFRMYREMLSQLDTITLAGRFVEGGLVFEELVTFQADSPYGKALEAQKLVGKADLAALPDMPYVMALSGAASTSQQNVQMGLDIINSLLVSEPLAKMPDNLKASIKKSYQDMMEQVTALQMVGGGPKDVGVFGVSMVIKCKDSAKMKAILADNAAIAQGLIDFYGKDVPDANGLVVKYVKDIEKVGDISADAIVVESPKMEEMPESDRAEMKQALGEDKVRMRVCATDKTTVVVTMGGSASFFAEAVKTAAANSGKIGLDPAAAAAMKHLPAERSAVVLFSASNLFDLILAGQKKISPDAEEPPFRITSKTPIAMGVGKSGKSMHVVVFIPTDLIKELSGIIMMFAGGGMGGGAAPGDDVQPAPPVGGSDF